MALAEHCHQPGTLRVSCSTAKHFANGMFACLATAKLYVYSVPAPTSSGLHARHATVAVRFASTHTPLVCAYRGLVRCLLCNTLHCALLPHAHFAHCAALLNLHLFSSHAFYRARSASLWLNVRFTPLKGQHKTQVLHCRLHVSPYLVCLSNITQHLAHLLSPLFCLTFHAPAQPTITTQQFSYYSTTCAHCVALLRSLPGAHIALP